MKRLIIINPKSGKGKGAGQLTAAIAKYLGDAVVKFTEYKGHAKELAACAVKDGFDQVIAAGGDGTINEVVQSLAFSNTALGVIPRGSGNGLAREFGMPLDNFEKACKTISTAAPSPCDLGKVDGVYFINLAGIGIEADIAHKFDEQGKSGSRGKWPYFKIGAQEMVSYKPLRLTVTADGETFEESPLTIVFANGKQYGSGFKIAHGASFSDGYLDMVIIPQANILKLALALPNFFKEHASPVNVIKTRRVKKAHIEANGSKILYHIDGEPQPAAMALDIEICEGAIKALKI